MSRLHPDMSVPEGTLLHLHPVMMEEVLYGCDVMPSAIISRVRHFPGVEPLSVGFGRSRLYTMPYGRQKDGTVHRLAGAIAIVPCDDAIQHQ